MSSSLSNEKPVKIKQFKRKESLKNSSDKEDSSDDDDDDVEIDDRWDDPIGWTIQQIRRPQLS